MVLVLAGCGVPSQDEPHEVDLPRKPLTETSAPAGAEPVGEVAEVLCLTRESRLAQVVRRVDAVPDPQRQLDQLVAGPTAHEQARGLSTALATTALTIEVGAGMSAVVEVGASAEGTARSDEALAYGQIVCTLTSRPDVTTVTFRRAGQPLQVPRADGTLSSDPLRQADYRDLLGPA